MKRRYVIADAFSGPPFLGNPVAVVLDAEGMSTEPTSCSDLRLYMLKPTFSGSTPGVWPACRASA